ncbi:L,D-transpeptidase family protein [Streptomyces sp. NPDC012510]|uniref:L,D-transpeptidase n=1 Tax=Streptomyces sp. NPDC012510 TaxID=3364838 RepID=UPI0036EEDCF9
MSDELAIRLRELAEIAEVPAPAFGAEVRATAGRRRRRRRTAAVVAGGCAAAALASFVTLSVTSHGTEQSRSPAATAVPEATLAAPDATVDLSRRVLTVGGRVLPVSFVTAETPTPTGLMTVTAKRSAERVTGETAGPGDTYEAKVRWLLELSPVEPSAAGGGADVGDRNEGSEVSDGRDAAADTGATTAPSEPGTAPSDPGTQPALPGALFIAALPTDEEDPGASDVIPGWIGLRPADAQWLYDRLAEGATVEIRTAAATPEPTFSQAPVATPPG